MIPAVAFTRFEQVSAAVLIPQLPVLTPLMTNLKGNGLKIAWRVQRTRGAEPDTGEVQVYNLAAASRGLLEETWGALDALGTPMLCSLSIGWEGLVGQVILAQVVSLKAAERVGEDVVTTFTLGDGAISTRDAVPLVGGSFANTTIQTIISAYVPIYLKVPVDPASLAIVTSRAAQIPVQVWANLTVGDIDTFLDDILDTIGLEWKIVDNVWIVTERGNAATASPLAYLLAAETGLLDWTPVDGGVEVNALANPNIMDGSAFTVIDAFGRPVGAAQYRVESLGFQGETDGNSTMMIKGRPSTLVGGVV